MCDKTVSRKVTSCPVCVKKNVFTWALFLCCFSCACQPLVGVRTRENTDRVTGLRKAVAKQGARAKREPMSTQGDWDERVCTKTG